MIRGTLGIICRTCPRDFELATEREGASVAHAGFSAVTYLFDDSQTSMINRNSLGGEVEIVRGGLHWTRAGSGNCIEF